MLALLLALAQSAPGAASGSEQLFERHRGAVFTIEVHTGSDGSRSSLGSGYLVDASGTLVTNHHVVASFIEDPERYRWVIQYQGQPKRNYELVVKDAEKGLYDAIVVGRRGLSRAQKTFMGSVSAKLTTHSRVIPVWVVDGDVRSMKILVAAWPAILTRISLTIWLSGRACWSSS